MFDYKMNDGEKLIVKHLTVPPMYKIKPDDWKEELVDSFVYGCDWLEHFQSTYNPVVALAIEQMAGRLERAEAYIKRMDKWEPFIRSKDTTHESPLELPE